jgi:transcription initiation factor IIE alpha subunit
MLDLFSQLSLAGNPRVVRGGMAEPVQYKILRLMRDGREHCSRGLSAALQQKQKTVQAALRRLEETRRIRVSSADVSSGGLAGRRFYVITRVGRKYIDRADAERRPL